MGPFKPAFKAFNKFLRGEGLFSEDTVATDGAKFRAQNSKKNNYNEKKIDDHLNYIEKQAEQYIREMKNSTKKNRPRKYGSNRPSPSPQNSTTWPGAKKNTAG